MDQASSSRHGAWPTVGPSYPGSRGGATRGRGRGRGGRGFDTRSQLPPEDGKTGHLVCGYSQEGSNLQCPFRTSSSTTLTLHKADRHLIYPPGGKEELERLDPLLIEERKEQQRRAKRQKTNDDGESLEQQVMNTIPGLNISLSTPELIEQWIAERKKRWPSDRVVQKKREDAWDDSSRGQVRRGGVGGAPQREEKEVPARRKQRSDDDGESSDSDDNSGSDSDSNSDSDSDSGSDAPSEEPIRKDENEEEQAESIPGPSRPVCRYFQAGKCSYGDRCNRSHDVANQQSSQRPQTAAAASAIPAHRRPRPRNPPQNPFEPRNLLHALLKNEIHQHVSTVAQLTRFLVRNDFLKSVELQPGQADEQARRRGMVQEVGVAETELEELAESGAVVHEGGLPTVASSSSNARSLYEPTLPTLRPLTSLSWPPEPDPLIFMDPLRRDDPKPLTNAQFESLATDSGLREILRPTSTLHPQGEPRPGLERALSTLDGLPSDEHRRAALELILGVSAQTPLHAHQIGPTFVGPEVGLNSGRFIGEVELFRLGLRCGPLEQGWIQEIAKRIGEVLEGSGFEYEPNPLLGWNDPGRQEGLSFREEKRRAYWEKEADRRDLLRKLGLDVD